MTSSTGSLLQSIQILVTGVPEKEKRRLHDIAKSQGAVILSTANANDPPHVVITRTVGSPRYFTILKRNASIPIVTPEWLTSSVEKNTRLPYADFAAGAFEGLVICFSGLSVPEKKIFSKQVESQGGRHSPVLDRSCTHLVTESTQSDKFIYAQLHGIYTITPSWIEESLAAGRCMEPTRFLITKPVGTSQHHSQQQNSLLVRQASLQRTGGGGGGGGRGDVTASGVTGDLTDNTDNNNEKNKSKIRSQHQGVGNVDASEGGRSSSEEPSFRKIAVDATGKEASAAFGGALDSKPSSRLKKSAAATTAVNETDAQVSATPWTSVDYDEDTPLFLDSCHIWVTCCSAAEEQETLVLCAQGGAKRFLEPHPTLTTHVIVGSTLSTGGDGAIEVAMFHGEHRDVPVVGLEWLRRSVARKQILEADERFTISVLGTNVGSLNGTTIGGTGARLLGNGGGSMSLLGFHSIDSNTVPVGLKISNNNDIGDGGGANNNIHNEGLLSNRQNSMLGGTHSLMAGFLDNCYFTLAAVRGTAEGDAAERLIRMHGGRIFSTSVPTSGKACYAICPYSLPAHKVHTLRMSHPDFAAVPEAQRFTLWWLECCVLAGEVLPITYGTACFQPLPFVLPLKDMDKVS
jgi:twin BRCT domain